MFDFDRVDLNNSFINSDTYSVKLLQSLLD